MLHLTLQKKCYIQNKIAQNIYYGFMGEIISNFCASIVSGTCFKFVMIMIIKDIIFTT